MYLCNPTRNLSNSRIVSSMFNVVIPKTLRTVKSKTNFFEDATESINPPSFRSTAIIPISMCIVSPTSFKSIIAYPKP